jgi:hypothetical protein
LIQRVFNHRQPAAARPRILAPCVLAASLCTLYGCSSVPEYPTGAVSHVSALTEGSQLEAVVETENCDDESADCSAQRYHYYLGLLSVYLIGL